MLNPSTEEPSRKVIQAAEKQEVSSKVFRLLGREKRYADTIRCLKMPKTIKLMADETGMSKNAMRNYAMLLYKEGILERERHKNRDYYFLTTKGELLKEKFLNP